MSLRNYSRIDLSLLLEDAHSVDWHAITRLNFVDDKVREFNKRVLGLCDKHAPLKSIKIKRKPALWLNVSIKNFMFLNCLLSILNCQYLRNRGHG